MSLKPAICTQCGAKIEVDDSKEAGICKHCGTAFITEKVIANYTNNYTTVNNITNHVTKIIKGGKDSDDAENFFNRGLTNLKLKKYVDARDNFEKAIELSPEVSKYYMYHFIAATDNFEQTPFPFSGLGKPNDLTSFFELTTEEEKQKFEKEYGMDFSCYEAFLVDSAEAIYLKNNFGYRFNHDSGKLYYDTHSLNSVIRIFNALKQEKYKQKFEEKVFNSVCKVLKDLRPGNVDDIKYALNSIDYVYSLQNSYQNVDIFCIALYDRLSDYMPNKKEEMYDLLAKRMYFVDENAGILYLKSSSYLPCKNFRYATIENRGTENEFVTIKVDDPKIHTIVLGGGCRCFEKFVLTKNITNIIEAGEISTDFSGYSHRYQEQKQEDVDYFEVEAGCKSTTIASIKSHFIIEKKYSLNKEAKKEGFKKTLIFGAVILVALILLFFYFQKH